MTLNERNFCLLFSYIFCVTLSYGQISSGVNGNNSNPHVNVEGKKVLTGSSNGSSRTGSTSRSNSATRRTAQNGFDGSGMQLASIYTF